MITDYQVNVQPLVMSLPAEPGWELFAALPTGLSSPVIRFAESDFTSAHARWVTG